VFCIIYWNTVNKLSYISQKIKEEKRNFCFAEVKIIGSWWWRCDDNDDDDEDDDDDDDDDNYDEQWLNIYQFFFNLDTEFDANAQVSLEEIQSCYVKRALSNCQVGIVLS